MSDALRADIQRETLALTRELVRRPSVTPDDAGCLDLVASRLMGAGLSIERVDRNGVRNLWARRGNAAPVVCLAGHVDVVSPGDVAAWTSPPFVPTERDGYLVGRGVADMKASVAAMVTAVERFVAKYPRHPGSVAVLLTSDEEGAGTDGTLAVVEALALRGVRLQACVVGEPTSDAVFGDTIKNGRRGSLNGRLVVSGVQCHIAYPERGVNPIHRVLPALAELASIEWDRGSAHFGPTSFQVSNLAAGTGAVNVIPGSAEVLFNFRYSTAWTADRLRARVHEVLNRHGLDYQLEWQVSGEPFLTEAGGLVDAVSESVESVTGVAPSLSTSGGTSDGRFLTRIADEVLEFGPRNETIHKVDERLALADLGPLSAIYEGVLERLLA